MQVSSVQCILCVAQSFSWIFLSLVTFVKISFHVVINCEWRTCPRSLTIWMEYSISLCTLVQLYGTVCKTYSAAYLLCLSHFLELRMHFQHKCCISEACPMFWMLVFWKRQKWQHLYINFYIHNRCGIYVCPGQFGVPKPWYFCFTKSYWCGRMYSGDNTVPVNPNIELHANQEGILEICTTG